MSTEPKKIKIKQALQICKDIEALHKMDDVRRIYHSSYGYKSKNFEVRVANNQNEISEIEVSRYERMVSKSERVPCNFWTVLFDTVGDYKMDPITYCVTIKNNGIFQHAPVGKTWLHSGLHSWLAARIIYHKMKKEYRLAKQHKGLVY